MLVKTHIATPLHLEAIQHEPIELTVSLSQPDGTPYSLQGHTATISIVAPDGTVHEATEQPGLQIIGNTIAIKAMLPLKPGPHQYQLSLMPPADSRRTIHYGTLQVLPSITIDEP